MSAIIEHVWTPDKLVRQERHGFEIFTAEELERLQQKGEVALCRANARLGPRAQEWTAELAQTHAAFEDLTLRALFEDSQRRIQSIALTHESLYRSGDVVAHVSAADYLPRLSQQLFEAYRVGDTGVGLPEGLDARATGSLGWQLVRLLTEQLRGTITLEGHGGTTVTITFPL